MANLDFNLLEDVLKAIGIIAIGLAILGIIGYLGFALLFGAGDYTQVTISAERLTANGVVDDLTVDLDDQERAVVAETIQNGSGRTVSFAYDPFFDDAPWYQVHGDGAREFVYVEFNGSYYRIDVSETTEVNVSRYTLKVVRANQTSGPILEWSNLPHVDKRNVVAAVEYKYSRSCESRPRSKGAFHCWSKYATDEYDESVIVPTPNAEYVRYKNQTYRLIVRERDVEAVAHSYSATVVTSDQVAFRNRFVTEVNQSELTEDERSIFEQAVQGDYRVRRYRHDPRSIPEERIDGLLVKFGLPEIEKLRYGHHGQAHAYIQYNGSYYRVAVFYSDTYA